MLPFLLALTATDVMPYAMVAGAFASICAVLAFLWKMLMALVGIRSDFKDMATKIGQKNPRDGLLGDIEDVKDTQNEIAKKQDAHDVKLAVIEANVAKRRTSDK